MPRTGRVALALTLAVALALAAGGCSPTPDGRAFPSRVDWTRAQAVWTDPWLAPTETTTAGSLAVATGVSQVVARDSGQVRGSADGVRVAEAEAAADSGWRLVGQTCTGSLDAFVLVFAKGAAATADQALATLEYSLFEDEPAGGGPEDPAAVWLRTLTAGVPHHLEPAWPDPPAVDLASGCGEDVPTLPASGHVPSDGPGVPVPDLPAAASQDALARLAGATRGDALLESAGLTVGHVTPAGDAVTAAIVPPRAQPARTPPGTDLAGLLARATGAGYTLTYAACGVGRRVAELRRPLTGTAVLTVRLTDEPDGAGSSAITARAVVGLPELAGPPAEAVAVTRPCWDRAAAAGIQTQGTPWFGPTSLQRSHAG
nr:hypothetical protein [Propionicimonas sp.]